MGNKQIALNEELFLEYEKRMLCHSGIPFSAFQINNVVIDEEGNFVRTTFIKGADDCAETIVFVHGYGGSGLMFWKIIKVI